MKKVDFVKKCNQAREHVLKMNNIMQEIFNELSDECLELPTNAENAYTVEDAICCFIQYGEYSPNDIWEEITSAKGKVVENDYRTGKICKEN